MKNILLVFISLFIYQYDISAQGRKQFQLNQINFYSIEKDKSSVDEKRKYIELFKVESGIEKYLLKHTILESGGDHNSEAVEVGKMIIIDSHLIFYTFWCRAGDAPISPYGARKQVYKVISNKLRLVDSQLYIEDVREDYIPSIISSYPEVKGQIYLHHKPKNETEKTEYRKYIATVEGTYNAKFVYGKRSQLLIKEVKKALAKEIQKATKHWDVYKNNGFGVKM